MAAQLFSTLKKEQPHIMSEIQQGTFETLFSWLNSKVYQHGAKLSSQELLQQATGEQLNPTSYLKYLREKYLGA